MGRPSKSIEATSQVLEELESLAQRIRVNRSVAFRAKIILSLLKGRSNSEAARDLRTSNQSVCKWRHRFASNGISGLYDEPRPGAPRKILDDQIERIVVRTLEEKPNHSTHWSSRMMAKNIGLSQSTICRVWRAFGLQPHRTENFQLSKDPLLVEKVRDIVGLYMRPPLNALVLCVDEKSQIQALSRNQPTLPMSFGHAESSTHEYKRHGTTSLFAALDAKTGKIIGECFSRHRSVEFKDFLDLIESQVPKDLDIHIILDNYATHKTPLIKRWLLRHPRYHLHFTPTHGSWLNMVERWFGLLTQRKIKRGSHYTVKDLKTSIQEYIDHTNAEPKPFIWTKSADEILKSIARYCTYTLKTQGINQEITDSGH
jgi:transposase